MNTPELEDLTAEIIAMGDARNWAPLPDSLRFQAESQTRPGTLRDLRDGYAALARATPEQRQQCRDWIAVQNLMPSRTAG